jgi:hypothetical protein
MTVRIAAVVALTVASAAMLAACGGVTYKDVLSHPEAHLYYPGSRVVSKAGADESSGLDTGRMPAGATTNLATAATLSEVYAWYKAELTSRGWKLRKTETIGGGYDLFTRGTRDVFYVSAAAGAATYSIRYLIIPAGCATSDPIPIDRIGNC